VDQASPKPAPPRARRAALAGALVLLAALAAVAHTWPLAARATCALPDNADAQLNAWAVSWIARQLPRDPVHLFDANTFFPERRSLAFSEPLLPAGLGAIALRGLGASPVLTHNLLLLAGLVLTALAGYATGARLSGSRAGGLLAGTILAFGPHTLPRLAHLQAQWLFPLALCLLALDATLRRRTWAAAAAMAGAVALLAVTSGYGLVLALAALAAALVGRADEAVAGGLPLLRRLAAAGALSAAIAAPVLLPYWLVSRETGLERGLQDVAPLAAVPTSYLATPATLHYWLWSRGFVRPEGGAYFPGLAALVLAALALALDGGWRKPRPRMLVVVALGGLVLSFGPSTPVYRLAQLALPPMKALRDPSRFGVLVILSVGLLAAIGLAAVLRRAPARLRPWLGVLVLALAQAEVFCAPFDFARQDDPSPVYERLKSEAAVAVAEFPFYAGEADYLNAAYVLASTAHWTPLVNGYSGMAPAAYEARARVLHHFPTARAIDELHRLGVSHVVVHLDRYGPRRQRSTVACLDARPDFELVTTGPDGARLYRLGPAPASPAPAPAEPEPGS
jgi:hypothetical protein